MFESERQITRKLNTCHDNKQADNKLGDFCSVDTAEIFDVSYENKIVFIKNVVTGATLKPFLCPSLWEIPLTEKYDENNYFTLLRCCLSGLLLAGTGSCKLLRKERCCQ